MWGLSYLIRRSRLTSIPKAHWLNVQSVTCAQAAIEAGEFPVAGKRREGRGIRG